MLSGQSGQIYGNAYTWGFASGWKNNLVTIGATNLLIWKNFFQSIPWWKLVPDQTHLIGAGGYGTPNRNADFIYGNDYYVTVAATADGTTAVAYFSQGSSQTLTVNMAKFAGAVTARWFDPTNAAYTTISGSPFSNTGTHNFSPSGNNSAGDPDWVLLLSA